MLFLVLLLLLVVVVGRGGCGHASCKPCASHAVRLYADGRRRPAKRIVVTHKQREREIWREKEVFMQNRKENKLVAQTVCFPCCCLPSDCTALSAQRGGQ